MKAVMISTNPKCCEMKANGKKTVDVRKTKPKLETPFKCYIYCTRPPKEELFTHGHIREYANELIRLQDGRIVYGYGMQLCCDTEDRPYSRDNFLCQKVIGEFICDKITFLGNISTDPWNHLLGDVHEAHKQLVTKDACLTEEELLKYGGKYAWHISDLVIYDKPKELSEFQQCHKCRNTCVPQSKSLCEYHRLKRPPQSWCYVEEVVL